MIDPDNANTLYPITGDVKDINTLLVPRDELRELVRLRQALADLKPAAWRYQPNDALPWAAITQHKEIAEAHSDTALPLYDLSQLELK